MEHDDTYLGEYVLTIRSPDKRLSILRPKYFTDGASFVTRPLHMTLNSLIFIIFLFDPNSIHSVLPRCREVQVGNDQEKVQSEKDPTPKNEAEKN